jgi:hypothetical protein
MALPALPAPWRGLGRLGSAFWRLGCAFGTLTALLAPRLRFWRPGAPGSAPPWGSLLKRRLAVLCGRLQPVGVGRGGCGTSSWMLACCSRGGLPCSVLCEGRAASCSSCNSPIMPRVSKDSAAPCLGGWLRHWAERLFVGWLAGWLAGCRSKTRWERRGAPTFSTLVEVLSCNRWRVHMNVARSVDAILAGRCMPSPVFVPLLLCMYLPLLLW